MSDTENGPEKPTRSANYLDGFLQGVAYGVRLLSVLVMTGKHDEAASLIKTSHGRDQDKERTESD